MKRQLETNERHRSSVKPTPMESRVLIIDDEEDVRTILSLFLKQKQCVVDCGGTLQEGIEKLHAFSPDVVFLDHMLPDGEGISAIHVIKDLNPDIRVIMISGMGEMNDKAMHAGADLFIKKPFRLREILDSLGVRNQPD